MNKFVILKKIKPKNPTLITGLPGIGLIGKLCVENFVKQLKAKKFAEYYTSEFPHQIILKGDTEIDLMKNEYFYFKDKKCEIIFVTGDSQAITVQGSYDFAEQILKFVKKLKVKTIITLGGLGVGVSKKHPTIYGAYTNEKLRDKFKRLGVSFVKKTGGIVGAAGLILGLGKFHKISGVCLMGETQGQFIDANAAKQVTKILSKYFGVNVNTKDLDKKAKEIQKVINNMKKIQADQQKQVVKSQEADTMHYIR